MLFCIMLLTCFTILMSNLEGNRLIATLVFIYSMYITYLCKLRIMLCVAACLAGEIKLMDIV